MNVGKRSGSSRDPRINVRPLVASGAAGSLIQLYTYKQESGGDTISGWSKDYITQELDPFVSGDITKSMGNKKWELGKNLFVPSWYLNVSWGTGTFGFHGVTAPGQDIDTTVSSSVTITVEALDKTEEVLGTVYSCSTGTSDTQGVNVTDLLFTNQSWSFDTKWDGSGSYSGSANAFLRTVTWSGSATTTGDPPLSYPNSVQSSPYLNIGPVKK